MTLSELGKPHSIIGILVLIKRRLAIRVSFLIWIRKASCTAVTGGLIRFFFWGGGAVHLPDPQKAENITEVHIFFT